LHFSQSEAEIKDADYLVLSHRMRRTYEHQDESLKLIREHYSGDIIWAEDMMSLGVK